MQVVLFGSVAVLVVGMVYSGCAGGGDAAARQAQANGQPAFKLGDVTVGANECELAISNAIQGQRQQGPVEPFAELSIVSDTLSRLVDRAATQVLAKKVKLALDDNSIIKSMQTLQQESLPEMKANMLKQGQLKPNATDKDFDEAFKKLSGGKTVAEAMKSQVDELKKNLADPKTRDMVVGDVVPSLLLQFYRQSQKITDEDVKGSYDEWTLKRIYLGPVDKDGPAALGDLKNGTTFEGVMTRYSKDPAQGGKPVADATIQMPKTQILSSKSFEGLRNLKVGGITDVVKVDDGYAIYKLIGAKNNAPKDFDTNKASYVSEFKNKQVNAKLREEIDGIKVPGAIAWEAKGYQAAYEYTESLRDPKLAMDPKAQEAKLRSIYEMAKAAAMKKAFDQHAAQLAQLQTVYVLYTLKGADHGALLQQKIEAMEAVLDTTASVSMELDLSDLYVEAKNGPKAADALVKALQANGLYDATGQKAFGDIAAKAIALKKAGMLSAADEKTLTEEQNRWREVKATEDKAAAETKKIDEEMKKKQEEEAKKAKATAPKPEAGKPQDPVKK